ncbi:MAG: type II and III secretion system protein family protein [Sphingomonadaceae bacterium]|nr:type II and III secretion system protein family protein [Sphingomonadaceae bacterium]MDW8415045.1 type II and III secretion system protein family protein [Thermaurantiacus sp.]
MGVMRRSAIWAAALGALASGAVSAGAKGADVTAAVERLAVEVGKGRLVRLDRPAASVFIANPTIADVNVRSPRLLYLHGRSPGETSLFAVDAADRPMLALTVAVGLDAEAVAAALSGTLGPGAVAVRTVGDALELSGEVDTAAQAAEAIRVAGRFVGADPSRVINRIRVRRPNQVALKVRLVEASREVFRALGFNWEMLGTRGDLVLGMATGNPIAGLPGLLERANGASRIGGLLDGRNLDVESAIDLLDRTGLARVLAEPVLTAASGEPASFLVGGEYPVPVPQEGNVTTIEFKRFGVGLNFVATIGAGERIHLKLSPEVSQLSLAGAVSINGIEVPALTVRRVETSVELASGQSLAVAGLVQASTLKELKKFPGLGDIPVLGELVRSRRLERRETELVVIVTPYLVQPVAAAALAEPAWEEARP